MKLTKNQAFVVDSMERGARLWRYGSEASAWLLLEGKAPQRIKGTTLGKLEEFGLIEEDDKHSYYRSSGPSDIVYKLTK